MPGETRFVTRSGQSAGGGPRTRPREGYPDLKRHFSILSALILDSSVEAGTPSRPAAPNGPATRPLHSFSVASMASFSVVARVPLQEPTPGEIPRVRPESHRASIDSVFESLT